MYKRICFLLLLRKIITKLKYIKYNGLKQRSSGSQKSKIGWRGCIPSGGSRGQPVPLIFQLLGAAVFLGSWLSSPRPLHLCFRHLVSFSASHMDVCGGHYSAYHMRNASRMELVEKAMLSLCPWMDATVHERKADTPAWHRAGPAACWQQGWTKVRERMSAWNGPKSLYSLDTLRPWRRRQDYVHLYINPEKFFERLICKN